MKITQGHAALGLFFGAPHFGSQTPPTPHTTPPSRTHACPQPYHPPARRCACDADQYHHPPLPPVVTHRRRIRGPVVSDGARYFRPLWPFGDGCFFCPFQPSWLCAEAALLLFLAVLAIFGLQHFHRFRLAIVRRLHFRCFRPLRLFSVGCILRMLGHFSHFQSAPFLSFPAVYAIFGWLHFYNFQSFRPISVGCILIIFSRLGQFRLAAFLLLSAVVAIFLWLFFHYFRPFLGIFGCLHFYCFRPVWPSLLGSSFIIFGRFGHFWSAAFALCFVCPVLVSGGLPCSFGRLQVNKAKKGHQIITLALGDSCLTFFDLKGLAQAKQSSFDRFLYQWTLPTSTFGGDEKMKVCATPFHGTPGTGPQGGDCGTALFVALLVLRVLVSVHKVGEI